jgi:hypothetical protein
MHVDCTLVFCILKYICMKLPEVLSKLSKKNVLRLYCSVEVIPDFVKFNLKGIKLNVCEGYILIVKNE